MYGKLEPGCLAEIIESTMGVSVGRIVTCCKVVGEHSQYGTVWEVASKDDLVSEYGAVGQRVHVPAIWLKKIEPGTPVKTKTVVLEKVE